MRRLVFLAPLALFIILAVYFALALRPGRDPTELPSAMIGKPMPRIDLASLDGGARLESAAFAGQVALVNFFASWCIPCRSEQPILMRLKSGTAAVLIGIAYKDKPEDTERYLAQLGDPYRRIGVDANGRLAINFGVYGVPETYVIGKDGRIHFRQVGPITADALDRDILPLVKKLAGS